MGHDRDLRTVPCLPGDSLDLDVAIDEFWHLELEKSPDELWMATGHHDLRALALAADLEDPGLDPVATLETLVGDLL